MKPKSVMRGKARKERVGGQKRLRKRKKKREKKMN